MGIKKNTLYHVYLSFLIFLLYQRMVNLLRRPLANNMIPKYHTLELINRTVILILKEGFEFEGNKIDVIQASDRELNFFNKENLSYLDKIVKKKFGKQVKKAGKVAEKKLQNVVMFAGKRYNNFSGLQTEFKNIISKTRNGAELETAQNELLKEVLKFHSHGEEKLKNVKGFTVDFHPTYKQTRRFFIVKEDDTREDFSLHKCLNVLKEQLINEE